MAATELQDLKDSRSKSVPEHLSTAAANEDSLSTHVDKGTDDAKLNENNPVQENIETVGLTQDKGCAQSKQHTTNTSENDGDNLHLIQVEDT